MKNFLSQFQGWAHSFAVAAVSAAMLYATNDAVHQAVNDVLASHKKLAGFLGAAVTIVLAYAKSQKSQ